MKYFALFLAATILSGGAALADPIACQGKPCGGVPAKPTPVKPTAVVLPKQQVKPAMVQGGASGGILSHNGANILSGNTSNILSGNTSNVRRP